MRRLRRYALPAAAVVCAALSVLLALLAFDVASWRSTVGRDDLRFRALPSHSALWRPAVTLPGDPASALLGTSSTIAWRRALQYFWYSRHGANPSAHVDAPTLRATAQDRLLDQLSSAPTKAQRSTAANLLGIFVVTTPVPGNDRAAVAQILRRAGAYFQQSVELDPSNVEAKENLEIVLRITRPGKGRIGRDARAGYGFGRGQGSTELGSGY